MGIAQADVQHPAAVAPYPALDAGTVIAQLSNHKEEGKAWHSMAPPLESLLRSLSLSAAREHEHQPAGAAAAGLGSAAGPSSRAEDPPGAARFQAALNSCALAVLQRPGTLSRDSSPGKQGAERAPSTERAQSTGPPPTSAADRHLRRPAATLAELLCQTDFAASSASSQPSTPLLHPPAAAPLPSVSLGAYDGSSPDRATPRDAPDPTSASASTGDLAAAAALSARLLSERLQQQACRPGLEAALAAVGTWPQPDGGLAAAAGAHHSWSAPGAMLLGGAAGHPQQLAPLPPHASLTGLQPQPGGGLTGLQLQDGYWAAATAAPALGGSLSLPPPSAAAWPGADLTQLQALLQSQQQGRLSAAAQHHALLAHQARLSHPTAAPIAALPAFSRPEQQLGLQPVDTCHSAPATYNPLLSQAMLMPRRRPVEQLPPECLVGLSGTYQPYCTQVISDRLNEAAQASLTAVKLLQGSDPPAAARIFGRRYFCSLKEVSKVVPSARCLVVAPDVRVSPTAHINPVRALQRILRDAEMHGVPVVFALSRKGIGQVFGKDKLMSIVALMNLEGLEGSYRAMLDEAIKGRQLFDQHRTGQLALG